jgi:hypothetical protein
MVQATAIRKGKQMGQSTDSEVILVDPGQKTSLETGEQQSAPSEGNEKPSSSPKPANNAIMQVQHGADRTSAAVGHHRASSSQTIKKAEPAKPDQQLALPIWQLPTPPCIEAPLRRSDVRITHPLAPLAPFPTTRWVYLVLLLAGRGTADQQCPYRYPQIGYEGIAKLLKAHNGVVITKDRARYAVKQLSRLKYLRRTTEAQRGTDSAIYEVLTGPSVMRMLRDAGCSHYCVARGEKIQLIRPISVV